MSDGLLNLAHQVPNVNGVKTARLYRKYVMKYGQIYAEDYIRNKKYLSSKDGIVKSIFKSIFLLIAWFLFCVVFTGMLVIIFDPMKVETARNIVTVIFFVVPVLVIMIIYKRGRLITDAQYDLSVKKQLKSMEKRALYKLGIDIDEVKEIAPIEIDGYNYDDCTLYKKGKDGEWRTNMYKVIYLFFSQNEVHAYTCEFCTTEGQKRESTDVYFYQDIVSVSTESSIATLKKESVRYESFKLTTSGGTSLMVSIRNTDQAERSISAMRQLLRSKKMSRL